MTKVFIGGSRMVRRLDEPVRVRIDRIVQKRFPVVLGDANGADKSVQAYLYARSYPLVEVFCSGPVPRNNLGDWSLRSIEAAGGKRDFAFYAAKDAAMAHEASVGLMIWDRKSGGTLMNVQRLVGQGKTAVLYVVPERRFVELRDVAEWALFLESCPRAVRQRLARKTSSPIAVAGTARQPGLF